MAWYEDWFDSDLYEVVYAARDEADAERAADLVERVARPAPGAWVLDVGTGRGRHARALARRGYRVTGLDLSPRAIDTARRRAAAEGLGAQFVVGDMREPLAPRRPLAPEADPSGGGPPEAFDGAVNLFSTFGYFHDEADHGRAVRAMATSLRPGGWLVQDLLNPPHLRARLVPRDERTVPLAGSPASGARGLAGLPPGADALRVTQERRIASPPAGGPRVEKTITLQPLADGEAAGAPAVFTESVRLLEPEEMEALYRAAGLRVAGLYGDFAGAPYAPESPRLILHGVREG